MFTHQKTLDVINAGLRALGEKELDGIPQARPDHFKCCVLGCSFNANLSTGARRDENERPETFGEIRFEYRDQRDKVLEAWKREGVECEASLNSDYAIRFTGGLLEWMDAFDGGEWKLLVDPDASPWDFKTVSPDALPPVAA